VRRPKWLWNHRAEADALLFRSAGFQPALFPSPPRPRSPT